MISQDPADIKRQVWELIRNLYEDRIGGLMIGDVFLDSGDILSLRLSSTGGLEKSSNALTCKVSSTGGLQLGSSGLAAKVKSGGGITVGADGFEVTTGAYLAATTFNANTIIKADADNTPLALTIDEQTLIGRITGGVIDSLTATEVRTLLGLATGDSPTFANVKLSGLSDGRMPYHVDDATGFADGPVKTDVDSAVSLKHAIQHTITSTADHTSTATSGKMLKADANGLPVDATNTDAQVSDAVSKAHSNASDHTQGTDQGLDTGGANAVTAAQAKAAHTHSGVTSGNPHSVSKSDVGLGSVENTALSTWAGTSNITTVGALSSGKATDIVDAATETIAGKVELATTTEAQAGTDTARVITPAGLNSVVFQHAKAQLINAVYGIVTPANVRLFLIFDQNGAVSTITDRSTIGGTTAHVTTLRDGSLNDINASTCTPDVSGLAPYLTFDATHLWDTPDAADLSFGNGSADSAFSIVTLARLSDATSSILFGKYNSTTGSTQREYQFVLTSADTLRFVCYDNSETNAYIGRDYNTAITSDEGSFHVYAATKSTGITSAAVKLYRDGIQVDDTNYTTGSYTAMEDKSALAGSYVKGSAGTIASPLKGGQSVLLVVAEELTAVQAARLAAVLRGYAGVTY